jgi:hypothetical protein
MDTLIAAGTAEAIAQGDAHHVGVHDIGANDIGANDIGVHHVR